jgi:hypothetical protein
MIPGRPAVLAKMLTPRRFLDNRYAAKIAPDLYGGAARHDPHAIKRIFDRQLMAGSRIGCGSPEIVEGFLCRFRLGLGFPDLVVDG